MMNKEAYEGIIRVLLAHIDGLEENVQLLRMAAAERDEALERLATQDKEIETLRYKADWLENDLGMALRKVDVLARASAHQAKRKVGRPKGSKNKPKVAA